MLTFKTLLNRIRHRITAPAGEEEALRFSNRRRRRLSWGRLLCRGE